MSIETVAIGATTAAPRPTRIATCIQMSYPGREFRRAGAALPPAAVRRSPTTSKHIAVIVA
jgi:hypothetical protein